MLLQSILVNKTLLSTSKWQVLKVYQKKLVDEWRNLGIVTFSMAGDGMLTLAKKRPRKEIYCMTMIDYILG